jgi:hypothetical protein
MHCVRDAQMAGAAKRRPNRFVVSTAVPLRPNGIVTISRDKRRRLAPPGQADLRYTHPVRRNSARTGTNLVGGRNRWPSTGPIVRRWRDDRHAGFRASGKPGPR